MKNTEGAVVSVKSFNHSGSDVTHGAGAGPVSNTDTNNPRQDPRNADNTGINVIQGGTTSSSITNSQYDPFEHRNVENPSSTMRSFANLLKASLGTGILAMPLAFANSGWLVGLVGTVVIAYVCGHCVHIFVTTSRLCCTKDKVPVLGYADTCKSTFLNGPKSIRKYATFANGFANFAMLSTYMGVCCIFTVLIADSIQQPLDEYMFKRSIPITYYCLAIIIPLCLIVQVKHLKFLAPFSAIANVLLTLTFGICLYYIFRDGLTFDGTRAVGDFERFPAYLSTVIFAMEGIGVVMPVENNMKSPKHFLGCPSVLVVAMCLISVMYIVLGLSGYLRYGHELRGSITLNLPIDEWPAICAKCFIALSIFLTYPLHFFVVINTLKTCFGQHMKDNLKTQVSIRIAVVLLCGIIGVLLPMLEQIINIVGAVFYSLLGLVIPAAVDTVACWDRLGRFRWVLWKNVLIVLFGLGCMFSGLTVSVVDIIHKYSAK